MARSQRWIKENILDKVPVHDCAHGFTRGRSSVTNARPHTGKELVINIDIKDFFPSITYPRIKGLFRSLGYSPAVSTILALLCSECPRKKVIFEDLPYHVAIGPRALPQGACSSPALSNMVSWKMDGRLYGLCNKMGWTYTRYADDITFSKPRRGLEQAGYILAGARHILEDEGFELNQAKTRVLKRSAAQTVTGVVVNDKPGVGRKEIRRIRAILNNAAQKGIESQNRDNHPDFEGYLKGWIAYISMVNPEQGASLSARFQDIRRS
jgi:retron-type reverse transcriptase